MRRIVQLMYVIHLLAATAITASAQAKPDTCSNSAGTTATFCEVFDTPNLAGGRGGDLDPTKWVYYRATQDYNTGSSDAFLFYPFTLEKCDGLVPWVLFDRDSQICGPEFGDHTYWSHGFNDGGNSAWTEARSLQKIDLSNGTTHLRFNVDLTTSGTHGEWKEIFIADTPVPAVRPSGWPSTGPATLPANGIDINFGQTNCVTAPASGRFAGDTQKSTGGIQSVTVIRNFQESDFSANQNCYAVQARHQNTVEIWLSQNRIQVFVSDASPNDGIGTDGPNFRQVLDLSGINLSFTSGYVYLIQAAYNAGKVFDIYGATAEHNAHWSSISWDGAAQPRQRAYSVPDSNYVPGDKGGFPIGYWLDENTPVQTFRLENVDTSNAGAARLSFNSECAEEGGAPQFRYRLNGTTWHTFSDPKGPSCWIFVSSIAPVPLSELLPGTNTLEFGMVNHRISFANLDLLIDPGPSNMPPPATAISGVQAAGVTTNSVNILWMTSNLADSLVEFGTTAAYGLTSALNPAMVTRHSVSLTGLTSSTPYHYRVDSHDSNGKLVTSPDQTFTTTAPPPPPPTTTVISGVQATCVTTTTSATILWATDNPADSLVEYGTTTAYGLTSTLNPTLVTNHSACLTGLTSGMLYHYRVDSRDSSGNLATSSDRTLRIRR